VAYGPYGAYIQVHGADPWNRPETIVLCNKAGPTVKVSALYDQQARCNRVVDHEGPCRLYDGDTFRVIAEWDTPVPDGDGKRKRRR